MISDIEFKDLSDYKKIFEKDIKEYTEIPTDDKDEISKKDLDSIRHICELYNSRLSSSNKSSSNKEIIYYWHKLLYDKCIKYENYDSHYKYACKKLGELHRRENDIVDFIYYYILSEDWYDFMYEMIQYIKNNNNDKDKDKRTKNCFDTIIKLSKNNTDEIIKKLSSNIFNQYSTRYDTKKYLIIKLLIYCIKSNKRGLIRTGFDVLSNNIENIENDENSENNDLYDPREIKLLIKCTKNKINKW